MAEVKVNQRAEILPCRCQHEQQDEMYGKGKRVHCPTNTVGVFRCTVCGEKNTKGK